VSSIVILDELNLILSAGEDKTIHKWDLFSGDKRGEMREAHNHWIWSIVPIKYDRKEKDYIIATSSADNNVKIWQLKKKITLSTFLLKKFAIALEYIPEKKYLDGW